MNPVGRRVAWLVILAALPFVGGCRDAPAVSSVRWQLEQQIPGAKFEREFHIRLGRLSLGLVKGLTGWVLEDDEIRSMLRAVKRVDVGTYRVVALPPLSEIETPRGLQRKLDESGWTLLVRQRNEDEHTWVFLRHDDGGAIRNLYVIALDEVELTMVSLEGRFDELLAEAIADDPSGFAAGLGS